MKIDKKAVKEKSLEAADILGFELVDIEFKTISNKLHIINYIYTNDGVTIDDCSTFSHTLGKLLDEADILDQAYMLEVSSPGLDRPLKNEKDYKRNLGKLVDVHLYSAINGNKLFQGYLMDFTEDEIMLKMGDDLINLPISTISLMKQAIIF